MPEFPAYQRPRELRYTALQVSATATFDTPSKVEFPQTLLGVRFSKANASAGQAWVLNVLRNGSALWTPLTGPAIAVGQTDSGVVAPPTGILLLAPGDALLFAVEQIGTDTPADVSMNLLVVP